MGPNIHKLKDKEEVKAYCGYAFNRIVAGLNGIIRDNVKNHGFIAGGFIRSKFRDEPVNDIDIYFKNETAAKTVKQEIEKIVISRINKTENAGPVCKKSMMEMNKTRTSSDDDDCFTENAWTFKNLELDLRVQLIHKYYGSPPEIIQKFDFTNSQTFYDPTTNTLSTPHYFLASIRENKLKFNSNCYGPIFSLKRLLKFNKQGYTIDRFNLLTLMKLAVKDKDNQEDFLNGGDLY